MDPLHPTVLPTDEEDRRAWLRYWLPGVSARAIRDIRREVLTEAFAALFGRQGMTDEDFDEVLAYYALSEIHHAEFLPQVAGGRRKYGDPFRLRRFIEQVMRIDVRLGRGGVAVLRDPVEFPEPPRTPGPGRRIEITWLRRRGGKSVVEPKSVRVVAETDQPLGFSTPDFAPYLAAFLLRIDHLPGARQFWRTASQKRPEPGRAPRIDWYRELLGERDRLVAAGERAPAKVIAERMDVNAATVRSWLKRADEYLKKGETDE